jgi:hypothetical protein
MQVSHLPHCKFFVVDRSVNISGWTILVRYVQPFCGFLSAVGEPINLRGIF